MKYLLVVLTSFIFFNYSCKEKLNDNIKEKNLDIAKNDPQVADNIKKNDSLNSCSIVVREKDLVVSCKDKEIVYKNFIVNEMSISTQFLHNIENRNSFSLLYEFNASSTKIKEKYNFIYSDSGILLNSKEIVKFGREGLMINKLYFGNYKLFKKTYEELETLGSDLKEEYSNVPQNYLYDQNKHLFAKMNYQSSNEEIYAAYPNLPKSQVEIINIENANNLAYTLQQQGANEDAKNLLYHILAQSPYRVVAWLNIGDVYWDLDDKNKAKEAYQKYISLMKSQQKELSKIPKRVYERSK